MTSPFGTIDLIADPGTGPVAERLPEVRRCLDRLDLTHRVHVASEPGGGAALARDARRAGGRFLVAMGDDAAVARVINGSMDEDGPTSDGLVIGVVPAGSENDLVRSFGLPGDAEGACQHLVGDNVYPLDLMKVATTGPDGERLVRYAVNLAEVGMGGEAASRERRRVRDAVGGSPQAGRGRFVAFWRAYLRAKPTKVTVQVDMRAWEGTAFNIVIGNGQFSGGLRLAPRSFPGDGVLDALIFHGPRSDAYTMLPDIYRHGDHVPSPHIEELRAKIRILIEAERPLAVVADGVPAGRTPVTFQVVPQPLRLKL
jgi:diacylglycerol kinase (ATP)